MGGFHSSDDPQKCHLNIHLIARETSVHEFPESKDALPIAFIYFAASVGQSEIQNNFCLHFDRLSLDQMRFESPPFYGGDHRVSQQALAAEQHCFLNCAIATDPHVQRYRAMDLLL